MICLALLEVNDTCILNNSQIRFLKDQKTDIKTKKKKKQTNKKNNNQDIKLLASPRKEGKLFYLINIT